MAHIGLVPAGQLEESEIRGQSPRDQCHSTELCYIQRHTTWLTLSWSNAYENLYRLMFYSKTPQKRVFASWLPLRAECARPRERRCGAEMHLEGKWLPRDFIKIIWPPILTEFRRGGEEKAQKWDEHLLDQTEQLSFAARSRIHTQTHTHTHTVKQAQTKTDKQRGDWQKRIICTNAWSRPYMQHKYKHIVTMND